MSSNHTVTKARGEEWEASENLGKCPRFPGVWGLLCGCACFYALSFPLDSYLVFHHRITLGKCEISYLNIGPRRLLS